MKTISVVGVLVACLCITAMLYAGIVAAKLPSGDSTCSYSTWSGACGSGCSPSEVAFVWYQSCQQLPQGCCSGVCWQLECTDEEGQPCSSPSYIVRWTGYAGSPNPSAECPDPGAWSGCEGGNLLCPTMEELEASTVQSGCR